MNNIYRIIWNSTLGQFVVASELAKGKGKTVSVGNVQSKKPLTLVISSLASAILLAASGDVFAAAGLRAADTNADFVDQDVVTTADKDYGASASGNLGQLSFTGGSITTSGRGAYGVVASDGGAATLNNTSVTTTGGSSSYGLYATRQGSINTTNVDVNSGSDDAVYAYQGSKIKLTGGSVTGGRGLVAGNNASISASQVNINTTGAGLFANASAITGDQLNITTQNKGAYGAYTSGANSALTLTDSNITTAGGSAYGFYLTGVGSSGSITGGSITTTGDSAYGVYATGVGTTINISDANVTTTGASSHALVVGNSGLMNVSNMTINSSGYGIYANNGVLNANNIKAIVSGSSSAGILSIKGNIQANNIDIKLNNTAVGIVSQSSGVVNASNINMVGDAGGLALQVYSDGMITANGLIAQLDSGNSTTVDNTGVSFGGYSTSVNTLNLENSALNITGNNALGIRVRTGTNTANLVNSTINAENGTAVYAMLDTDLTVNADNSTLAGTTLLQSGDQTDPTSVVNSAYINATNNSQLVGDVNVIQAQTLDSAINLDSGSAWRGAASGLHSLSLNDGSQWDITGDSDVGSLTANNSTLNFVQDADSFKTLTVNGNYAGDNATLVMNSQLGGDDSATDKLHITGDSSGTTHVVINNAGGMGAQTLEGIDIIQVDGAANGKFTQQGRIVAGAYDYNLVQGTGDQQNAWLLTSQFSPDPIPAEMTVRPEAGSYVANLAASNTLFNTSLDDRLGETRYVDAITGETKVTSLWLRNEGGHTGFKDNSGQLKTTSNRYVMQLGGDVAQWTSNGDDRFHLGVMGGYANAQSNTRSNVSGYSSKGQINGYSAGVYGSWFQDNAQKTGAYLDSWALYNWFNNSVKGDSIGEESYKSKGITASVEGGYTLKVGELNARQSYYIQPKAQVTWMGVEADNHTESNGTRVADEGNNNVQTRLGVRAFIKGHSKMDDGKQTTFEPFVEANWLHNTEAFGTNMNGASIRQAGASNIAEVKVGVDAKLTQAVNLWGNIGKQIGDKGYSDSSAMVGVKVSF